MVTGVSVVVENGHIPHILHNHDCLVVIYNKFYDLCIQFPTRIG